MSNLDAYQTLRCRFAPSLSGHLHLGDARLGVLSWLATKKQGGELVMLVPLGPDPGLAEHLLKDCLFDLRWLGISWDEGPEVGGPYAPYVQWERHGLYREFVDRLIAEDKAYRCYCTEEELQRERREQIERGERPHYSGKCRGLSASEERKLRQAGRRPRVRVRAELEEAWIRDVLGGVIRAAEVELDDFVLVDETGEPASALRFAVDDGLLGITCVLQTEDRLNDALREALVARMLGFAPPDFVHVPALLGPDGLPLSDRHGVVTIRGLREQGYLPEAIIAYLAQLSGQEIGSPRELNPTDLAKGFDLEAVAETPGVFSHGELAELNREVLAGLPRDRFASFAEDYLRSVGIELPEEVRSRWLELVQTRVRTLADLAAEARVLIADPDLSEREARDVLRRDASQKALWSFLRHLQQLEVLTADGFRQAMKRAAEETGLLGRDLWDPVRLALLGRTDEAKIAEYAEWLGRERCEHRIRRALEVS